MLKYSLIYHSKEKVKKRWRCRLLYRSFNWVLWTEFDQVSIKGEIY